MQSSVRLGHAFSFQKMDGTVGFIYFPPVHSRQLWWKNDLYKPEIWGVGISTGALQITSQQQVGTSWCVGQRRRVLLECFPVKLFEQGMLKCLWQEETEVSWHTRTKEFCEPWPAFLMSSSPASTAAAPAASLCGSIQFKLVMTHDEPGVSFAAQIYFQNCHKQCIYRRSGKGGGRERNQ